MKLDKICCCPRPVKPRILDLIITTSQSNLSIVFIFVCCQKKRPSSCRFRRTTRIRCMRAQQPYARSGTRTGNLVPKAFPSHEAGKGGENPGNEVAKTYAFLCHLRHTRNMTALVANCLPKKILFL